MSSKPIPEASVHTGQTSAPTRLWDRLPAAYWPPLGIVVLAGLTLLAYAPAMNGGFVSDDLTFIYNNSSLRTLNGLKNIWLNPAAGPQYYPLVFTSFWVEFHLWGLRPLGYHLVNVGLHVLCGVLIWLGLRRLRVPGGWLAAAIFCLHPVHVESVAWMAERKNVLSLAFYLLAVHAYMSFSRLTPAEKEPEHGSGKMRHYGLAMLLFIAALFSKTVTCSLPVALGLLIWWWRGRLKWSDVIPLLPMLAVGAYLAYVTLAIEQHLASAHAPELAWSWIEAWLISGRAAWFYLGKLVWPTDLTFVYPRWEVNWRDPLQHLYPLGAMLTLTLFWALRNHIGRAPCAALLFYGLTMFPTLGFFRVAAMGYSFVADRWQYHASIGPLALLAALVAMLADPTSLRTVLDGRRQAQHPRIPRAYAIASAVLLAVLAANTRRQAGLYRDGETLWTDTLRKNPDAWVAHNNLGVERVAQDRIEEAIFHFNQALDLWKGNVAARTNLGKALSLRNDPDGAKQQYRMAIAEKPDYYPAYLMLGKALMDEEDFEGAIKQFSLVLDRQADHVEALVCMGTVRLAMGQPQEALPYLTRALETNPNDARAHSFYGLALAQLGKPEEGFLHLRQAVRLKPDDPDLLLNLTWQMATSPQPRIRNGEQAVKLAELALARIRTPSPNQLKVVAAAYAEDGRYQQATLTARRALDMAGEQGLSRLSEQLEQALAQLENQLPIRQEVVTVGRSARPASRPSAN